MKYTLEEMIYEFQKHILEHEENVKNFPEIHDELDKFSYPKALMKICEEIQHLKKII